MAKRSVCIIKLGGMGDVLRTTPVLRRLADAQVTWVTGAESVPLLEGIPCVKEAVPIAGAARLAGVSFDELYNFDEDERACRLAGETAAGIKKGYGLKDGAYFPFDRDAEYAYRLSRDDELKFRLNVKTYQQVVFEMAGLRWQGEEYVLGYRPQGTIRFAVGINHMVGEKFPNKAWPRWRELAATLDSVSVQQRFGHVHEYIEWIQSCNVIVTGDTLGMHVALALGKKVVLLMGSTSWNEIETYGRATIVRENFACAPCYKRDACSVRPSCMEAITPGRVRAEISKMEATGGAGP